MHTTCGWSRHNPAGHLQPAYQHASPYNCGLHTAIELRQNKQGQRTYSTQSSPQQSAQNQNHALPNSRTGVQRNRSQGADRFSGSRTIGKLRSQTVAPKRMRNCKPKQSCTSKLLAFTLNSVWLHYVRDYSLSHRSSSYLCSSCLSSSILVRKNKALLIRCYALHNLHLWLHILNGVTGLHLDDDRFAGKRPHK